MLVSLIRCVRVGSCDQPYSRDVIVQSVKLLKITVKEITAMSTVPSSIVVSHWRLTVVPEKLVSVWSISTSPNSKSMTVA